MIPKKKCNLSNLFIILFYTIAPAVFALPSDHQQPLNIQADFAQFYRQDNHGFFRGHVHLVQGTTQIDADKLTVYMNSSHQLIKAIAEGNPAIYRTLNELNHPPLVANASKMTYSTVQHHIILQGKALVIQGANQFSAPQIIYDTVAKTVVSKAKAQQHTTIIIKPESNSSANKLNF
ncbi:MAG: lipopolysaccharide transport periplasmic protein LptA [Legionellales bacterium]|nr:lipopolysaccharide transport periplasmic protein LptA [Legionellales bacterium]